ncbi:hypothetical protein AB0C12_17680 [Actinoplanes sp. NPDC048967]|uniref:TreTu family toxin n=1 Tax=Actinoplanes sp. NPDC048967 TaxID=3155269 RepID=UPI003403C608
MERLRLRQQQPITLNDPSGTDPCPGGGGGCGFDDTPDHVKDPGACTTANACEHHQDTDGSGTGGIGKDSGGGSDGKGIGGNGGGRGDGDGTVRVGRRMRQPEYTQMLNTGMVQEGSGGFTYVVYPASKEGFTPNRPGSIYVEFGSSRARFLDCRGEEREIGGRMLRNEALLSVVMKAAIEAEAYALPPGASGSLSRPPEDRRDYSVTWQVACEGRNGQLTVWDDGNAEVDLIDMESMEDEAEHLQLDSSDDVAVAVAKVVEWMKRSPVLEQP